MRVFVLLFMFFQLRSIGSLSSDSEELSMEHFEELSMENVVQYEKSNTLARKLISIANNKTGFEEDLHFLKFCFVFFEKQFGRRGMEQLQNVAKCRNSFFGYIGEEIFLSKVENVISDNLISTEPVPPSTLEFCKTIVTTKNVNYFTENFYWLGFDFLQPWIVAKQFWFGDFKAVMNHIVENLSFLISKKKTEELKNATLIVKNICSTAYELILKPTDYRTFKKILTLKYQRAAFDFLEQFQTTPSIDMIDPIRLCQEINNILPDEKTRYGYHQMILSARIQKSVDNFDQVKCFLNSNKNNTINIQLQKFLGTNNSEKHEVAKQLLDVCVTIVNERLQRTDDSLYHSQYSRLLKYLNEIDCKSNLWPGRLRHGFARTTDFEIQSFQPLCQESFNVVCNRTDDWYSRSFAHFNMTKLFYYQERFESRDFSHARLSFVLSSKRSSLYWEMREKLRERYGNNWN